MCPHACAQPRVCLGVHVCAKEAEPAQPACQAALPGGDEKLAGRWVNISEKTGSAFLSRNVMSGAAISPELQS